MLNVISWYANTSISLLTQIFHILQLNWALEKVIEIASLYEKNKKKNKTDYVRTALF